MKKRIIPETDLSKPAWLENFDDELPGYHTSHDLDLTTPDVLSVAADRAM